MTTSQYDILFYRNRVKAPSVKMIKARLAKLFKARPASIEALFRHDVVVLKKSIDKATAVKYKSALQRLGVEVEIVAAATEVKQQHRSSEWSVAPAGVSILSESKPTRQHCPEVDTSNMSLCPLGGYLLDASEQSPQIQAPETAAQFNIAEVGADLLTPGEKSMPMDVSIDTSAYCLSKLGADVLDTVDKKPFIPRQIDTSHFDLLPREQRE